MLYTKMRGQGNEICLKSWMAIICKDDQVGQITLKIQALVKSSNLKWASKIELDRLYSCTSKNQRFFFFPLFFWWRLIKNKNTNEGESPMIGEGKKVESW